MDNPWVNFEFLDPAAHPGRLSVGSRYRPLMLHCETVNSCNNHCVICAYTEQRRAKKIMPTDLFEKVLRDYSEMGGGPMSLTPIVGDVLLDRHLLDRLDLIRRYPAITGVSVTTNAAMLDRFDDGEVKRIAEGFSSIQVSIYGLDEEEYEAMTKRRTYSRMVDGARRLLAAAGNRIYLAFRLLKDRSRAEIDRWIADELLSGIPGLGLDAIKVNSVMTTGYANWGVLDTSRPLPFEARWQPDRRNERQCMIPILAMQVFSNGRVSFCPCDNFDDVEELSIGDVTQTSLLDIYNSPKVRALWDWQGNGVPDFCRRCSFHLPMSVLEKDISILEDPFKIAGG